MPTTPIRPIPLSDVDVSKLPTSHLLNIWFAIMNNRPPTEYRAASNEERADFYMRIGKEIDARIPIPGSIRGADV